MGLYIFQLIYFFNFNYLGGKKTKCLKQLSKHIHLQYIKKLNVSY